MSVLHGGTHKFELGKQDVHDTSFVHFDIERAGIHVNDTKKIDNERRASIESMQHEIAELRASRTTDNSKETKQKIKSLKKRIKKKKKLLNETPAQEAKRKMKKHAKKFDLVHHMRNQTGAGFREAQEERKKALARQAADAQLKAERQLEREMYTRRKIRKSAEKFQAGDQVKITGLVNAVKYNGHTGRILGLDQHDCRYRVYVDPEVPGPGTCQSILAIQFYNIELMAGRTVGVRILERGSRNVAKTNWAVESMGGTTNPGPAAQNLLTTTAD